MSARELNDTSGGGVAVSRDRVLASDRNDTLGKLLLALQAMRSGDLKYESVVAEGRTWRTFGNDTAIVTSKATLKASHKGQDMSGTYRATTVLRRVGDRWVIVSTHLSPLAAK